MKSGVTKKSNMFKPIDVSQRSVIENKAIGDDTINENGFGDETKNSEVSSDSTSISDAQTSTGSYDDETSDSGSQDKTMQAEMISIESKSITAVCDTNEEAAQAILSASINNKRISANISPNIQDACTSDKRIVESFNDTDDEPESCCGNAEADDSSYDTLLTITMKMAEEEEENDESDTYYQEPVESNNDLCSCINCEFASQLEHMKIDRSNVERVITSVQTSMRSMGGAENNGKSNGTKGLQTLTDTPSRIQKIKTDYDSEYYINQHRKLYESREKQAEHNVETDENKKKVSINEKKVSFNEVFYLML